MEFSLPYIGQVIIVHIELQGFEMLTINYLKTKAWPCVGVLIMCIKDIH